MNFSESKTKENLMRAFAGESQARNRYIFSAHKAKDDGLNSQQNKKRLMQKFFMIVWLVRLLKI